MKLIEILKDTNYKLTQFSEEHIADFEKNIIVKEIKGKPTPYVVCAIRNKEIKLTPEEVVRQLFIMKLMKEYNYPQKNIRVEVSVQRGRDTGKDKKRIDILVEDDNSNPYIVVEVKKPKEKEGQSQLESYVRWNNAPLGVLCNGSTIEEFYHNRENKGSKTTKLDKISDIPVYNQKLSDFLSASYTLKNLFIKDELQTKTLKKIILDFEDVVLANSGVDSFEEIFKLIFTKLYDEHKSARDFDRIADFTDDKSFNSYREFNEYIKTIDDKKFRKLEFRSTDDENFRPRLDALFQEAKKEWEGIFERDSRFELTTEELRISVSYLQDIKLFNSNFEVVDDAFEYLVTKSQKGDKGQYFTPRYVIDMCVRMLNPQPHETMIDTAAGSCGFPMHTILYVWNKLNSKRKNLISAQEKTEKEAKYVTEKVFAIDFDKKSVRIGRLLNKIAGDGETNVLHLNSLHFTQWKNDVKVSKWEELYKNGFKKFETICTDTQEYVQEYQRDYSKFNFDVLMANPPFAGDITNENLYKNYELGKNKISRDILFIERNLNFLKDGGRMAIVLPQGRFNNSSDKAIREFIAERCRILAVVGLHGNVFKPHTGTKTSVLFVQKWHDELCPKVEDYPIFFATMQEPSKDNSGEKIYVTQRFIRYFENGEMAELLEEDYIQKYGSIEENTLWLPKKIYKQNIGKISNKSNALALGAINNIEYKLLDEEEQKNYVNLFTPILENRYKLDSHGHLIVKHDLFNHDGLTQDGIAEAFIEFAKKEQLSFF